MQSTTANCFYILASVIPPINSKPALLSNSSHALLELHLHEGPDWCAARVPAFTLPLPPLHRLGVGKKQPTIDKLAS